MIVLRYFVAFLEWFGSLPAPRFLGGSRIGGPGTRPRARHGEEETLSEKAMKPKRETCRVMDLGGITVRVRGPHPMSTRDIKALTELCAAALKRLKGRTPSRCMSGKL